MRIRCAVAVAGLLALAGCGDDGDHANKDRPPSTINVTAAIAGRDIHVSPRRFGGGPIRLIVSNQTGREQELTLETAGRASGVTGTTGAIRAAGTAHAADRRARGRVRDPRRPTGGSGPRCSASARQRPSAQNELLLP